MSAAQESAPAAHASSTKSSDAAMNEQTKESPLSDDSDPYPAGHVDNDLNPASASQERKIRGLKWVVIVVAILSSTFLFSLDNTVVADVQPTVIRQFDSVDKLPWLSVGYLLGSTTTNLLW